MAPLTRKRKSELDAAGILAENEAQLAESKRQKKLPVRAKDEEAPADAEETEAPTQPTMKVFTDDDEVEAPKTLVSEPVTAPTAEEDDDDDSDDEAPEAVSTQQVASSIKKSEQAAKKAAQEQAAADKRKRQQKDALFKQQAEERRKLEEEEEAKAAAATELSQVDANSSSRRRRAGKVVDIPDVLPAELLADSSSEDEEDEDDQDRMDLDAPPKKRKISTTEKKLARKQRAPRDEQIGSTVYRVAKKIDDRMAPKAKKHTKSSKDVLLRRNRAAVKSRSGFLIKK